MFSDHFHRKLTLEQGPGRQLLSIIFGCIKEIIHGAMIHRENYQEILFQFTWLTALECGIQRTLPFQTLLGEFYERELAEFINIGYKNI